MITTRYIDVAFGGARSAMARALYQYDYGQILRITDLELPVAYEVHFALNKSGNSVTQIGNADGVNIPDAMLLQNGSFYAWFYLHQTGDDGETRYEILFPVMQRAKPTNQEPTPVQQDAITEAIAALNAAVEQTGADVEAAAASASAAADSESNAEAWAVGERDGTPVEPSDPTYHNNSAYYASVAESASQGGEGFALKSEGFAVGEQNGVPVSSDSPYYHNNAEFFKNQSSGYSSNASAKASAAAASALVSEGYAVGTQDGSEVSSGSPYYHHNAAYYATDAGASAYNASVSETNAGNSATDAGNAKTAAQTAQGLAEAAKTAADADALKAEGFAVGEQDGVPVASGSPYYQNNAEYYAGEASNSATSASGSASSAGADALIAEGWAKGTQNGTPVASGTYFEDNSKYYAEQAEDSATSAETAQTAAETARDAAIAATEDKAPVILDSASGAIVSIVDGAQGMNARSLVAAFSPIQDLHGQDSPYPAGGGVNKCGFGSVDFTLKNVRYYTVNGILHMSGTSTGETSSNDEAFKVLSFSLPAGTYYFTRGTYEKPVYLRDYDTGDALVTNSGSFTLESDATVYVGFYVYNVTFNGSEIPLSITAGSTAPASYTPYSNICPISGRTGLTAYRTGVNLCKLEPIAASTGASYKNLTDNSVTVYSATLAAGFRNKRFKVLDVKPFAGETLTISLNAVQTQGPAVPRVSARLYESDGSTTVGSTLFEKTGTNISASFSLPAEIDDGVMLGIILYCDSNYGGPSETEYTNIMLNLGSSALPYEPYVGTTYPVTWQDDAGTVYGGAGDLVSGLLTVTHKYIAFASYEKTNYAINANANGYYLAGSASGMRYGSWYYDPKTLCDTYPKVNRWADKGLRIGNSSTGITFCQFATDYPTLDAFYAYISGANIHAVIPIEPQTYQLTPTQIQMLFGVNNIWSTGDTVDLTYPCDTRLYIERLTEPTEDDMVANANIPIHQYFMIGNSLYYSTAAIAQGAAIIVGTNCNRVGLADALNALA